MPTIKDILDGANTVYYKSLKGEELVSALAAVRQVGKHPDINEQNKEKAQFLEIKINLKILAVAYFCNGYERADFLSLSSYVGQTLKTCDPSFVKTIGLMKSVLAAAEAVDGIVSDAEAAQARVRDCEGKCVARDAEECREVAELFGKKVSSAEALSLPRNIFTDGASFPDVGAQLIEDLAEVRAFAEKNASLLEGTAAENILRTGAEDITDRLKSSRSEYFPLLSNAERLARAIVLCTPVPEEAELFAYSCANGAKIYALQALAFENRSRDTLQAVFSELGRRGADCLIYGAPHFRADNKGDFYRAVMNFCKGGRRAYLVADDGTRRVYDAALAAAAESEGSLTSLDVSLYYLSLPDFLPTVEEMKNLGMISDSAEDAEWVRKFMPFAGFAGLNEGVAAFRVGADWKKIVSERSEDNYRLAEKYMLNLNRQGLLIDGGWGNYHDDVVVKKTKRFDYDDIRTVNPNNIRKIMEGNFTLFQKCGMIATYCLLCGASAQDWAGFSVEIKSERLTEACKLVMRALGMDIVPVVEVKEELDAKGAGGLCCDGGKRILYKNSCVSNFDWTAKAVCHECFHAFQHAAEAGGWQEWYMTELHVTPGRIEQWRYNSARYHSIEKGFEVYMIQIYECDARAFEEDCLGKDENRGQILNLLDLD